MKYNTCMCIISLLNVNKKHMTLFFDTTCILNLKITTMLQLDNTTDHQDWKKIVIRYSIRNPPRPIIKGTFRRDRLNWLQNKRSGFDTNTMLAVIGLIESWLSAIRSLWDPPCLCDPILDDDSILHSWFFICQDNIDSQIPIIITKISFTASYFSQFTL